MAFLLKCSYLFATLSSVSCFVEQYKITRTSSDSNSKDVDVFHLPPSKCSTGSTAPQCSSYNALSSTAGPCACSCSHNASTFGHVGSWSCLNNTNIRAQAGCKFKFTTEQDTDAFRILKKSHAPLPTVLLPSDSCFIDLTSLKYLTCESTLVGMKKTSSPIRIVLTTKLSSSPYYKYSLKVENVDSLKGKLISLQFKCSMSSKSSCLLFKMAGETSCPVNIFLASSTQTPLTKLITLFYVSTKSTGAEKRVPEGGKRGSSSGTLLAVVIVVIIVILAAIIGFMIWKRKRNGRLRIMDRLTRMVRKCRSPTKPKTEKELDESTYAEIHDQSHQRPKQTRTNALTRGMNNIAFQHPTLAFGPHKQQDKHSLYEEAGSVMKDEITDAEEYLVPLDSPIYIELTPPEDTVSDEKTNNYNLTEKDSSHRGWDGGVVVTPRATNDDMVPVDSAFYDVLEAPDEQNDLKYDSGHEDNKELSSYEDDVGRNDNTPITVAGPSDAAGNDKHVTKQRRRPPSPPRKKDELLSSGNNKINGMSNIVPSHKEREGYGLDHNCKSHIYESLNENKRALSIYEPLDRTNSSK